MTEFVPEASVPNPAPAVQSTPSAKLPLLPLPDRLSADPRSKFHVAVFFETGVGVRLNGKPRTDVEEYCVSEGWVKVPAGKAVDRKGFPLTIKLKGVVEVFHP